MKILQVSLTVHLMDHRCDCKFMLYNGDSLRDLSIPLKHASLDVARSCYQREPCWVFEEGVFIQNRTQFPPRPTTLTMNVEVLFKSSPGTKNRRSLCRFN